MVIAGVALVVLGLIVKTGFLGWFGSLPGDIRIKREGFQLFVPITSMIVVSLVFSALAGLLRRFL